MAYNCWRILEDAPVQLNLFKAVDIDTATEVIASLLFRYKKWQGKKSERKIIRNIM